MGKIFDKRYKNRQFLPKNDRCKPPGSNLSNMQKQRQDMAIASLMGAWNKQEWGRKEEAAVGPFLKPLHGSTLLPFAGKEGRFTFRVHSLPLASVVNYPGLSWLQTVCGAGIPLCSKRIIN